MLVDFLPPDGEDQYSGAGFNITNIGALEVLIHIKLEASHSHINGFLRLFPSCSSSFYLDRFGESHALFCPIFELITKTTEAH